MDLAKTTCKRIQETFKFGDLVRLILEVLRWCIYASLKLFHHWFRQWTMLYTMPSTYIVKCYSIVLEIQWCLKQNTNVFFQENMGRLKYVNVAFVRRLIIHNQQVSDSERLVFPFFIVTIWEAAMLSEVIDGQWSDRGLLASIKPISFDR